MDLRRDSKITTFLNMHNTKLHHKYVSLLPQLTIVFATNQVHLTFQQKETIRENTARLEG